MAQHIGLVEIDETGKVVKRSDANFALVNKALTSLDDWRDRFPWLSKIDEYGDTTFNYLQLPNVLNEIDMLKDEITSEEAKEEIKKTKDFIGSARVHKYIKFIGD